jgi:hypothetical protein
MQSRRSVPVSCLLLTAALVALPGCKLKIKVPQGGVVYSTDGAYTCAAGDTCVIDVVDFFFDETFIAEPDEGYYFKSWSDLDGFLCGGQTTGCRLATADHPGNTALQSMLESDKSFFLQPQFVRILKDCPEPELVISPGHTPAP